MRKLAVFEHYVWAFCGCFNKMGAYLPRAGPALPSEKDPFSRLFWYEDALHMSPRVTPGGGSMGQVGCCSSVAAATQL